VVLETQPLVIFARQPDRAVVHLPAIHSVSLQFCARAEISICKKKYNFWFSRKVIKYFIIFIFNTKLCYLFNVYTDRKRISCVYIYWVVLTRQDRFLIHAKCPTSSFCTYSKLTCLSIFFSVSRIGKIESSFCFSTRYTLMELFWLSNFLIWVNVIGNSMSLRFNTVE